jgi:hypothetical protein
MIEEAKKVLREPPITLTLRRTAIQSFPGGQKVALYFCEQVKKYFSFTYGKKGIELMEEASIIDILKDIKEIQSINFNDGSSINIDEECCNRILELYEELDEGKEDFAAFIMESDRNFLKILDYSVNKYKKET